MNINATLLVQMGVFFILAYFTMKFVWPPLIRALDERAKKVADGLAAAEKGNASLAMAEKRIAEQAALARAQVQERIQEAEKQAQMIIDTAKQKALEEAKGIVRAAEAEAMGQVAKAKEALRAEVAALALEGARRILEREVSPTVHADLLNNLKQRLA